MPYAIANNWAFIQRDELIIDMLRFIIPSISIASYNYNSILPLICKQPEFHISLPLYNYNNESVM